MGQLSNLSIYRLRKWMARYRFLFPSTMTPLSDISPKTVTQQEFLLFHIIPAAVQGLQQYNKKNVSLLVSSSGILHYSVTTVPCWRLRGVSGERLKHAQVQAICQLPDRTDGLDCTELSVLSAIWCYLWFSEADTFRYMAFPVAGQSQHSGSQPAATLAEDAPWKPGAVHAQCTAVAQQGLILFFWADRWMWSCRRTSQQWYWRTIQQEFMGVGPPSMETLVKTVKTTIFLTPEADCSRCFEQRCFEFAMFSTCFQLVHYVLISLDIYRSAGWDCCFMPCSCFSDRFTWTATNVTSVKDGLHILCQT